MATPDQTGITRRPKANWQLIEQQYVEGDANTTYESLAQEHAVGLSTVNKHGSADGWRPKRDAFRQQAGRLAQQKGAEQLATRLAAESADRQDTFHGSVLHFVRLAMNSEKGSESLAYMNSAGIAADKLHRELDRVAPVAGVAYVKETKWSREAWLLNEVRTDDE